GLADLGCSRGVALGRTHAVMRSRRVSRNDAIRRASFLITLGVIAVQMPPEALAEALPTKGALDARVRVASYSADQVYRLYGYVGYQIDLQFEPGESFLGLGAGDIKGISFVAQDNHLFLKPKAPLVGTNLTVLTTRRHYQFDYAATARRPDPSQDEVIYALRFT